MKHLAFLFIISKMNIFQLNIISFRYLLNAWFTKCLHIKKLLYLFNCILHLSKAVGEYLNLCHTYDHRHSKHNSKSHFRNSHTSLVYQKNTNRNNTQKSCRHKCKCQFHSNPGILQPFDNKVTIIHNGTGIFLITYTGLTKGLYNFNSLDIFNYNAVHMSICFLVLSQVPATYRKCQRHKKYSYRKCHKCSEGNSYIYHA